MSPPQTAAPTIHVMENLARAAPGSPEAKAASKKLVPRLRALATRNKRWFVVLALALAGIGAYASLGKAAMHAYDGPLKPIETQVAKAVEASSPAPKAQTPKAQTPKAQTPKAKTPKAKTPTPEFITVLGERVPAVRGGSKVVVAPNTPKANSGTSNGDISWEKLWAGFLESRRHAWRHYW